MNAWAGKSVTIASAPTPASLFGGLKARELYCNGAVRVCDRIVPVQHWATCALLSWVRASGPVAAARGLAPPALGERESPTHSAGPFSVTKRSSHFRTCYRPRPSRFDTASQGSHATSSTQGSMFQTSPLPPSSTDPSGPLKPRGLLLQVGKSIRMLPRHSGCG